MSCIERNPSLCVYCKTLANSSYIMCDWEFFGVQEFQNTFYYNSSGGSRRAALFKQGPFTPCLENSDHIRILGNRLDNTTVVAHIVKQGGTLSFLTYQITRELLLWCMEGGILLCAKHIMGAKNVTADSLSRPHKVVSMEWSLDQTEYQRLCRLWGTPSIDLFVTRWNTKLPKYVSPHPDDQAWSVDAMSIQWTGYV